MRFYSNSYGTKNHNAVSFLKRNRNDERSADTAIHHAPHKSKHPDEVVLGVMRAMLIEGLTTAAAAERYGVTFGAAHQWRYGLNKGRLLDQVLREKEKP